MGLFNIGGWGGGILGEGIVRDTDAANWIQQVHDSVTIRKGEHQLPALLPPMPRGGFLKFRSPFSGVPTTSAIPYYIGVGVHEESP